LKSRNILSDGAWFLFNYDLYDDTLVVIE